MRKLSTDRLLTLGLALYSDKRMMENRVRGIFGRKRTAWFARVFTAALCLVVGVACFTTACKPERKTQAAVSTGAANDPVGGLTRQTEMLMLAARDGGSAHDIPARFDAAVSCGDARFTITGDAPIRVLSENGEFPVVRVTPADFTQRQANRMRRVLLPRAGVVDVRVGAQTRRQIEATIRNRERQLAVTEDAQSRMFQQMWIDELKAELATAPEKVESVRADGKLKRVDTDYHGEHMGLYIGTNAAELETAQYLRVDNNSAAPEGEGTLGAIVQPVFDGMHLVYHRNVCAVADYFDNRDGSMDPVGERILVPVAGQTSVPAICEGKLAMTPTEAEALVRRALEKIGADMAVESVNLMAAFDGDDHEKSAANAYWYAVRCTMRVGSAQCAYLHTTAAATGGGTAQFGTWMHGFLDFMIDDRGIGRMEWYSPHNVEETLVRRARLLPFDTVMERYRAAAPGIFGHIQDEYCVSAKVEVTDVVLGLVRIPAYDNLESGLLVPAWCFYGTRSVRYAYDGESEETEEENGALGGVPLLVLNAVNGSVLDVQYVS